MGMHLGANQARPAAVTSARQLSREWAHPCHVCGWTGLTAVTSAQPAQAKDASKQLLKLMAGMGLIVAVRTAQPVGI